MQFLTGFLQFYRPDCSGNEDGKCLAVHAVRRYRRILFLQIVGWHC
jgi:hypothetical protein